MSDFPQKDETFPRKLVRAISSGKFSKLNLVDVAHDDDNKKGKNFHWSVLGVDRTLADDFHHICLELNWLPLIALVFLVYTFFSLLFAAAFWVLLVRDGAHFVGERLDLGAFEECLWLSVGHLVTIGYGGLLPATRAAFVLATVEHFVGIFLSAILLGVVVTKASIPTAKVVFSKHVLFTTRNGEPTVMFRVGNTRGNFLLNPEVRVSYFRPLDTVEGEKVWAGTRLDWEEPPLLAPSFNLTHRVTETSPFYNMTEEEILRQGGSFTVSMAATDEQSLQTLYARKLFSTDDVLFNVKFGDVLLSKKTSKIVDFRRFDDVFPITGATTWVGSRVSKNSEESYRPSPAPKLRRRNGLDVSSGSLTSMCE
ncbi:hypothetical protein BSKO_06219 [Bryopsis sp. KO-2023]|nr:hypothetical protein BSKO_06219 [Bryopsis sp. KO-2023]